MIEARVLTDDVVDISAKEMRKAYHTAISDQFNGSSSKLRKAIAEKGEFRFKVGEKEFVIKAKEGFDHTKLNDWWRKITFYLQHVLNMRLGLGGGKALKAQSLKAYKTGMADLREQLTKATQEGNGKKITEL